MEPGYGIGGQHLGGAPEAPPRHVWILNLDGEPRHRLAGLLVEWRKTDVGWEGLVITRLTEEGAWMTVERWIHEDDLVPVRQGR